MNPRNTLSSRFLANCGGNAGMLYALMALPMFGTLGLAIDYGRAVSAKTTMQAALDAGMVAGLKVHKLTGDVVAAEAAMKSFIAKNLADHGMKLAGSDLPVQQGQNGPVITVTLDGSAVSQAGLVAPTMTASVETIFMRILSLSTLPVDVQASAANAGKKLELALMLDTTGSMQGQKLIDMKTAAKDLLDIILPPGNDQTRVSVVPFSSYVNVGSVDLPKRTGRTDYPSANCVLERKRGSRTNEAPPVLNQSEFWVRTSNDCPSAPIVPLTGNKQTLVNAVDGLNASGATAGHLGTAWSWHTISPLWSSVWPAASAPAAYSDPLTIKAVVLMTDGNYTEFHYNANTGNPSQPGSAASCNGSDDCPQSRQEARNLCDAMKTKLNAKGDEAIMIFTVGFGLEPANSDAGQKARDTLTYCASTDPNDKNPVVAQRRKLFYFPYSSTEMRDAFKDIGNQLAAARAGAIITN